MIGKTILHYKIKQKLGEGGMGVVYLAEDTKLERQVAIKFLPRHIAANSDERKRFEIEARAAAALNHPNIATIHAIEETDDDVFLVMEYVEGQELAASLKDGALRFEEVEDIALQIAQGLEAAHQKEIVHRDIKSSNIMITKSGMVKIMDFGLAKVGAGIQLTKEQSTLGTAPYMSPEQVRGEEVDSRSDIWSFGVLLFEMLAGQLPFPGEYEQAVVYAIVNEEAQSLSALRPDVPERLKDICERCLKKEISQRIQTIREIIHSLNQSSSEKAEPASITGSSKAKPSVSSEILPENPQRSDKKNKENKGNRNGNIISIKKPTLWIAAAFAALTIAAWFVLTNDNTDSSPFQNMSITHFTTHGRTGSAAISPDGKYIAYVLEDRGKRSLWLNSIATRSNVQIIPPRKSIRNIIFSSDGNHIFFRDYHGGDWRRSRLFRVPVLGGEPEKIAEDVSGPVSFSPTGKEFAFFRFDPGNSATELIISDLSGSERVLLKREKQPWTNDVIAWSPDGVHIAYHGVLDSLKEGIILVDSQSGEQSMLNDVFWGAIDQLAWTNDGRGLLISAAHRETDYFYQIWYVSYPGGKERRVTNDPNNYNGISITGSDKSFITVKSDWTSNIWVAPGGDFKKLEQVSKGKFDGFAGLAWTPDGHIVHGTRDWSIWLINKDGTNGRLLTGDNKTNRWPDVSSDGKYIIFESWRNEKKTMIYRLNLSGGKATPINDNAPFDMRNPQISPANDWVVCEMTSNAFSHVAKIPVTGGDYEILSTGEGFAPAVSPDGKTVAFFQRVDGKSSLILAPLEGGEPVVFLEDLPEGVYSRYLRWTSDGKAITLIIDDQDISNLWNYPMDGSAPRQITFFKVGESNHYIMAFDWAANGDLLLSRGQYDDDVVLITRKDAN